MIDGRLEDNLIAAFAAALRSSGAGEEWKEEWEKADSARLSPLHKKAFDELLSVFRENENLDLKERRIIAMHRACAKLRELAKS